MIGGDDIYKVVTSMLPLYTAILLGYASVKWWHMFKPADCDAINRFNCYFVMPFFTFHFISTVNPYSMNYRFFAADVMAKVLIGLVVVLWANLSKRGSFSCSITTFSLSSLNNTLVVGVPLLEAMYGDEGRDLVIQSSVIQSLLWFICLLFMLEMSHAKAMDIEDIEMGRKDDNANTILTTATTTTRSLSSCGAMKIVLVKLALNPNTYACVLGLLWALLAKRWHFGMPKIIEGSISIMSKGGAGLAMFSMGLFMALQEKIIACGVGLTLYAMVLRFVVGPVTTAVGAFAMGLHGDVLRIVVIQAALPQALASFVYAQEYGLHAQVLSTAVIFGTVVSLPLLVGYYALLDILG
ncbi:OLC1v1003166C1 [Oldenlandia corymbosa var. corymbosa]|uniref:Auxin efflux carrier component n=2 Tax=Oldenlandia corymbosa var. corymbosa TaxID=529605 RepID=A0AAV1DBS9_OLDCO|nr:OLC1v1003166C1 [Oldenlandia corymbosa var. corymbosa]